ncbi:hypothetical protein [Bradyrhizobium japonicum]|uniref:hypothetical protein n=1 Tax=Bradyrhizobium japonicum TaxID=375 RepID=UPI001E4746D1|nr:hypothetical protein [Bradyrhizobium japonicum]MCD9821618.1 hypothetical protein [Bradyrhizobium japonicum]MEB2678423.1 hypothetical protein [Bradyrhizobium japonicum]WRI88659.1 hypothetical protein R3F75_43705 [Bradyrhizobium japonicum]
MAKAKPDDSTPEQPTAIGRLAFPPEQRAAFQRMMAEKLEQAARLDKAGKVIDRANAIRDGLIPPPWAEQLLKPASIKTKTKKEGPKERRVKTLARGIWPPDGNPPPELSPGEIIKEIGKACQKGEVVSSRQTILRALGRLPR